MKYTDEQIEKLLLDRDYFKVVDALVDIVQTDEATFHDHAAFIDAVSSAGYTDCYEIAFQSFIKANTTKNANPIVLKGLYLRIDPIIKALGFRYFDAENSHNIPRDFYLRAKFMLYIAASKYNDALVTISMLIDEDERPTYYFQRSKLYSIQKKYQLALMDLDKAVEMAPTDATLYYHRALLKQKLHDIQGAFFDFESAINFNSQNYIYYYSRGMLNESFEHYKNALDDFKKTIQLNPNYVQAFQEIAWCKYKLNYMKEALSFINIAIQMDKNNAGSYYIRGCINNTLMKHQEAAQDEAFAIKLDNQSNKMWTSRLWHQKAWAEFRMENYEQAEADINQALKLYNRNLAFLFLAMDIQIFGTKNFYNAMGICKEILKLDPDNQRALMAKKEIEDGIRDNL